MKEYLKNSLEFVESNYPNSAVILGGDFNKFCFKSPAKLFHLKPIINFPTSSSLGQFFQNVPFEDILSSIQSPCENSQFLPT